MRNTACKRRGNEYGDSLGRLVLFLTLSLFFVSVSGRNERPFFFSHLGVEDGLSQVSVLNIFQDSEGIYLVQGREMGLTGTTVTSLESIRTR